MRSAPSIRRELGRLRRQLRANAQEAAAFRAVSAAIAALLWVQEDEACAPADFIGVPLAPPRAPRRRPLGTENTAAPTQEDAR